MLISASVRAMYLVIAVAGMVAPSIADAGDTCECVPLWPTALPSVPTGVAATPALMRSVREGWDGGANFACSARLMIVGSGTGCASGVIFDAATEKWQVLPFAIHRDLEQQAPLLQFQQDGRVLTATGWLNETRQGTFRYCWDGHSLSMIERDSDCPA